MQIAFSHWENKLQQALRNVTEKAVMLDSECKYSKLIWSTPIESNST